MADITNLVSPFVISTLLNRAGFSVPVVGEDLKEITPRLKEGIKEFQQSLGLTPADGSVNNTTLDFLRNAANQEHPNTIKEGGERYDGNFNDDNASSDPHYSSFFDEHNGKTFRQNGKNIKIVFGEGHYTKCIIDVIMRSQSVEVNTSGEPISEVYEFIARDITESDESSDIDKYLTDVSKKSTDVKYNFNY